MTAPTKAPPQLPLPTPPNMPKKKPKKAIIPHPKAEDELLFDGVLCEVCIGITGSRFEVTGQDTV